MSRLTAKSAKEARELITDLEQRAARVLEITGAPVDVRHMQSVLWSTVDPETKKHTAQYLSHTGKTSEKDLNELKAQKC